MSSGDDIVAGEVTTCETTTDLIGARPNPPDVPFNGVVVFRAGPQPGALAPRQKLDGIHGIGTNASVAGSVGGTGVAGFGGPLEGLGMEGFGGGLDGAGGSGVVGRGGKGSTQTFGPSIDPGTGIVGLGGVQDVFETTGRAHGAGVVGIGGNGPFPSFTESGNVGVYGQGGNADRSTQVLGDVSTLNGPLAPGIGVLGRGATQSSDGVDVSPTGAGVVGVSGFADLPTLGEFGGVGVLGKSRDGTGVVGLGVGRPGVSGRSDSAAGVFGSSEKGVGVAGHSAGEVGGYFSSDRKAQLHLEPLREPLDDPNGTLPGRGGDLVALKRRKPDDLPSDVVFKLVTLWFCQNSGTAATAVWTRVA